MQFRKDKMPAVMISNGRLGATGARCRTKSRKAIASGGNRNCACLRGLLQ